MTTNFVQQYEPGMLHLSVVKMMKKRVNLKQLSWQLFSQVPNLDVLVMTADSAMPEQARWLIKQGAAVQTEKIGHDGDAVAEANAAAWVVNTELFIVTRQLALTWRKERDIKKE